MKIKIEEMESSEYCISPRGDFEFDVPDDQIARWEKVRHDWDAMQEEIGQMVSAKRKEANDERKRQEAIQHEQDRLEVERLRREWREKHEAKVTIISFDRDNNTIVNRTAQTTIANEPIHVKKTT